MSKNYRIGQAAKMLGLNTSVLRYWESEFEQIEPIRTQKGQRMYSEEHIRLLERIRTLLHDDGLTIDGARKRLDQACAQEQAQGQPQVDVAEVTQFKQGICDELKELRRILDQN